MQKSVQNSYLLHTKNYVLDCIYIDGFVFTRSLNLVYMVLANSQSILILIFLSHTTASKLQKFITSPYEVRFRHFFIYTLSKLRLLWLSFRSLRLISNISPIHNLWLPMLRTVDCETLKIYNFLIRRQILAFFILTKLLSQLLQLSVRLFILNNLFLFTHYFIASNINFIIRCLYKYYMFIIFVHITCTY